MKKFLALVLALAMCFALVACGSSSAPAATTAPAAAAPAASSDAAPAAAAESTYDWPKLTLSFTCSASDNTCWADMGRQMNQYLSERTGGKITVETYAQDQLANGVQKESIQMTIDGSIDICAHSNLIYAAFDPRFNVVSLPFIYDSTDDVDALLGPDGAGFAALAPLVEELGLHLLGVGENGFRHPTNSVRPIDSLEAMSGLKLRVAGTVTNMAYAAWGANYSNANWSEVYTGLQTGTYEGQENPLPTADGASIADVQKYVTYWTGIYDCLFMSINQDLYDSLAPEVQALLDECGAWATAMQRDKQRNGGTSCDGTTTYGGDADILAKWEAKGITVTELSADAVAAFKEASSGVPAQFVQLLVEKGYDQAQAEALVAVFAG